MPSETWSPEELDATAVVLTGAGFSKDAGLPLEREVIPRGLEYCRTYKPELIEEAGEHYSRLFNSSDIWEKSIEELLTRLAIEELYSGRDYVREIMPLELAVLEIFAKSLVRPPHIPEIYARFLDLHRTKSAFVSLNQDLLLERLFQQEEIYWFYALQNERISNQFRPREHHYYDPFGTDRAPVSNVRSVPYLKLHGSFNWHFCWRCGDARVTTEQSFGVSGELFSRRDRFTQACVRCTGDSGQAVMRPLVVAPTLIKRYDVSLLRWQWAAFDLLLRNAEHLLVVGCSLRREDTLLLNALSLLRAKCPSIESITLVNPNESTASTLQQLSGLPVLRYDSLSAYVESPSTAPL